MYSQRMVAAFGVVLLSAASAGAQFRTQDNQDNRSQMRFADMDRNRDGRITRAEWRGTVQEFDDNDWNNDNVLSGDEVRVGAVRPGYGRNNNGDTFDDWTPQGFAALDRNRDHRLTRAEWRFDSQAFQRADHNRDGVVSRSEFLSEANAAAYDDRGNRSNDDRSNRLAFLDTNNDGRISRAEWRAAPATFDTLDENRDGYLSRTEMRGNGGRYDDGAEDLFSSIDTNHDGVIRLNEWHWSRASWDARDTNRDGRVTRQEFLGNSTSASALDRRSPAFRAGYDRGTSEGRQAGREDKQTKWGYDLDGQQELERADSGYEPRMGSHTDYQAGYREGFRRAYEEGYRQAQ